MKRDDIKQIIIDAMLEGYYDSPLMRQNVTIRAGHAADTIYAKMGPASVAPTQSVDERNRNMVAAYRRGQTLEEIGQAHNLTRERVRQVLDRMGEPRRPGGRSRGNVNHQAIADAFLAGTSITNLARQYGTTVRTIRQILKRHGIDPRVLQGWNGGDKAARDARMVEAYRDGYTTTDIAYAFDMSPTTVSKILRRNGVELRKGQKVNEERDRHCARLYELGFTMPQVAERLGISIATVGLALNRQGVKSRKPGERPVRSRVVAVERRDAA